MKANKLIIRIYGMLTIWGIMNHLTLWNKKEQKFSWLVLFLNLVYLGFVAIFLWTISNDYKIFKKNQKTQPIVKFKTKFVLPKSFMRIFTRNQLQLWNSDSKNIKKFHQTFQITSRLGSLIKEVVLPLRSKVAKWFPIFTSFS